MLVRIGVFRLRSADFEFRTPLLVGLAVLALLTSVLVAGDEFGVGGTPWFGWWDSNSTVSSAYELTVHPRAGGASARGGLRDGDILDLRKQRLDARAALVYQPLGGVATLLVVRHAGRDRVVAITPSSVWDNATFWKLQPFFSRFAAGVVCALCAIGLALRLRTPEAAVTALSLTLIVGIFIDPSFAVLPGRAAALWQLALSRICATLVGTLIVGYSFALRPRTIQSQIAKAAAYVAVLGGLVLDAGAVFGLVTLDIDPLPFIMSISQRRSLYDVLMWAIVSLSATRVLRPLPLALFVSAVCFATPAFVHNWVANVTVTLFANAALPVGAVMATILAYRSSQPQRRYQLQALG